MSSTIKNFLITILFAIVLGFLLPWWSVMIAGILSAILIPLKRFNVFIIPFLAIALYWMVYSFILGNANDFVLSKKIGTLFSMGNNWILVLLLTGVVGGIAGGIAAILGKQIMLTLRNSK